VTFTTLAGLIGMRLNTKTSVAIFGIQSQPRQDGDGRAQTYKPQCHTHTRRA
jgi:hypothetical protein